MWNKTVDRDVIDEMLEIVSESKYIHYDPHFRLLFYWKAGNRVDCISPFGDWEEKVFNYMDSTPTYHRIKKFVAEKLVKFNENFKKHWHPWKKCDWARLKTTKVTAQPREIKSKWTQEMADELTKLSVPYEKLLIPWTEETTKRLNKVMWDDAEYDPPYRPSNTRYRKVVVYNENKERIREEVRYSATLRERD